MKKNQDKPQFTNRPKRFEIDNHVTHVWDNSAHGVITGFNGPLVMVRWGNRLDHHPMDIDELAPYQFSTGRP